MIDQKTLGKRIKFFRKRAGLSQFNLENEINASAGMISRIESGKINPTKETIRDISKALEMNNRELDYLIGDTATPVNENEINAAKKLVTKYFHKPGTFAYLIDERWRLHYYSKGIEKIISSLENPEKVKRKAIGKSMIEVTSNPDIGLETKLFPENYFKTKFLKYQLTRYYEEVAFMFDDESVKSTLEQTKKNKMMNAIWKQILNGEKINTNSIDAKTTYIKILGVQIKLNYSREPIPSMPRFETIEIFPNNKLLNLLKKLL